MNPQATPPQNHGLELGDIYYVLFRHKWKILLCTLAGLLGALALFRNESPPYQSEAKLLVRYVVSESKPTPGQQSGVNTKTPDEKGAAIMNTEQEILSSGDLAKEVADSVGPEKILAKLGGGKEAVEAANAIRGGLIVYIAPGSSVISLTVRHPDPDLVRPILQEVIERYLKLHLETHRAAGMLGDALQQEADTLRSRLNQTEEDLRKELSKAGITSLDNAKEEIAGRLVATRREIANYEAELAGRIAVYEDIRRRRPAVGSAPTSNNKSASPEVESELPYEAIEEFRSNSAQLARLQAIEQELLLQFTPETLRVKEVRAKRSEAEANLKKLREKYPTLTKVRTMESNVTAGPDAELAEASSTWLQIMSLQAKIKTLNLQSDKLKADAARLDLSEGQILELRRRKEIEEANYKFYASNLEQNRISQTLGSGKVSNITTIQKPSPAFRAQMSLKKVGLSAVAGIGVGLLWAFLIEIFLDRTVRRPIDLQRMLRIPLFLSIPRLKGSEIKKSLAASNALALTAGDAKSGDSDPDSADPEAFKGSPLHLFHETLRDRLIGFFESKNLTHKPKLVAVTGLSSGSGVTTTAAGLARSLSETGEGNVLLVDMTIGHGSAQQFVKGRPTVGLDELLEARSQAHVHENLYVVAETSNSERLSRNLPQRFSKLVPKLKASDFDYIIFDMPTVNQLSITPRLASFMDMVLLVVESEKSDREVVQGACGLLAESKAQVGIVLNKTRAYVPAALQQQLMAG
ncbi:GumC family protein [Horticoccus sp. 23ND18S-11]|uniref:GumC family protein n=1 Tax=Horticoccus sp. 23ND18S-11 TaxID=3391832 RepID=UPI0039C99877